MDINKMKIGDYARCGSAGIRKVNEIIRDNSTQEILKFIDNKGLIVDIKYVQNYNSNPLELVELGDCINRTIITHEYFNDGVLYRDSDNVRQYDKLVKFKKNEIKSFITREQLEHDEYIFNWN